MGNLFDFTDVFDTMWGSDASGGEAEMVTASIRDSGTDDGVDGRDVELWGMGCVVYRPAKPDEKGRCQLLVTPIGGQPVAIASRDLRAAEAVGALNEGDAAFCSPTGKNVVRCNADGSMSMLQQGDDADALIAIEKGGAIVLSNKWGQIVLDEDGFKVITSKGTVIQLDDTKFAVFAAQAQLNTGVTKLHAAAVTPATFIPASGVAVPAPNVFF